MNFTDRSYGGKLFCPTPLVHYEEDLSFFSITTSWSEKKLAKTLSEQSKQYFFSLYNDRDSTFPFSHLTCLSSTANILRATLFMINDSLYNDHNKSEYNAAAEMLILSRDQKEINWAFAGSYHVFLSRPQEPLRILSASMDLAAELSSPQSPFPPLPGQLLGVFSSSNPSIRSYHYKPQDKLLFIYRSFLEPQFFQVTYDQVQVSFLTQLLSKNHPDLPFWLGILELS
ncbi:MAG: hypothetical protein D6797_03650 [Bdellovibrio sp.]|nr:MAG: hypothetical protein D6797_03650 [Bdellovibrio sp.]